MKWTVQRPDVATDLVFEHAQEAFNYIVRHRPLGAKLLDPDGTILLAVGELPSKR